MAKEKTPREKMLARWSGLKLERSSWFDHWKDVSEHLLPRAGRYFITDRNRGEKRHRNIIDNTGTRALRVLAAGMMAGMTSPARPWFRLTTDDPELAQFHSTKAWLTQVQRQMLDVFQRSNTYRSLHGVYEELGAFGTAASIVMDDFDKVLHHYPLTAGEYAIATDYRGTVNTLYREFEKRVVEVVAEFDMENCSPTVQRLYRDGNLDAWVPIVHAIEPRADRDYNKRDQANMAFSSCYFEPGESRGKMLSEGGFRHFPGLCPRWATTSGDMYGHSPGMEALGDIRQLQHEQKRKAQGIDYMTRPPLQVPGALKSQDVDTLPGGISFYDGAGTPNRIQSLFDVNLRLDHLLGDIGDVRGRINSAFYADLFLMLSQAPTTNMTATEVAERHEEKLLVLGPVLERLHNELLDPLIEGTFARMIEAGVVPPPPEEMQGRELKIEFVSMLAQAQRAIGTNSIDRFVGTIGVVAGLKPDVLDKLDADELVDRYADALGVDPDIIVADEEVAIIRTTRARAQQAAAAQAQAAEAAATAQTLAQTPTGGQDGPTALNDIINMFSGYGSPSAVEAGMA